MQENRWKMNQIAADTVTVVVFLEGLRRSTEKEDFEKDIQLDLHKFYRVSLSTRRDCTGEDASLENFIMVDKMGTDCDELFSFLLSWTVFINICNRTE